jgi:hypothetical protein
VIAIALPILFAYAAYRTVQISGVWHVILPFAAVGTTAAIFLSSFLGFNVIRKRGATAHTARDEEGSDT